MPKRPYFISYSSQQRILMMRRLSLYLRSGISLPVALSSIAEDSSSISQKFVISEIEQSVLKGESLSRSLARFPSTFDAFTVAYIEAGEASGSLPQTLAHVAEILQKRRLLTRTVLSALLYPGVILTGTILMSIFLTFYIFPKILPVLQGLHTTLPITTRLLLDMEYVLLHDWIEIIIAMALVASGYAYAWRYERVRYYSEYFLLRVPLFGSLYRSYGLSMICAILAMTFSSGIRIIPALQLARKAIPGLIYRRGLEEIENQVANGRSFSSAFKSQPLLFPLAASHMVAVGEATGTLRENLSLLASDFEHDLDQLTKNLAVLIEPVLMIGMGFMVGFIALAIITPLYGITQNLNSQP